MSMLKHTLYELHKEIDRIVSFIREQVGQDEKVILGLSGGIDSDVTARLCVKAIGSERLHCFTVIQDDFEDKYISNARHLANEIGVLLVELPLAPFPKKLIQLIAEADPTVDFRPNGLLDVARSKCALRTFVYSAYMERGYLAVGPSNRTEIELGYYLPFGDGLSHFSPIAHLYKTEVQQIARVLGTSTLVLEQQPAAGFWQGDSDLEGISYWLYNEGPIAVELELDDSQEQVVRGIQSELSFHAIDTALLLLRQRRPQLEVVNESGLSSATVERLIRLQMRSALTKNRPLKVILERAVDPKTA